MNGLDIALLVVLIFFFLRGIFRGFVKEIVGVLALVVGFVIASSYYPALGDALKPFIQQQDYRNTIGFEVLFLVAFFLISLLGLLIDKLISIALPGWISGLIGAGIGVFKGIILAAVILMAATVFIRQDTPFFKDSASWPYMKGIVASIRDLTPDNLKNALEERRREIPASLKPKLPELSDQDESSDTPPPWMPVPGTGSSSVGNDRQACPLMNHPTRPTSSSISLDRLIGVLDKLLDPDSGCPWDLKQTPDTVRIYLLEETYELLDAVESGQPVDVREEIGDCLFLLCFLTRLYERQELFDLASAISGAADKMIARHPHIFTETPNLESAEDVRAQWHQIKNREKKKKKVSRLGGVPRQLPSLLRAHRLTERAGQVGFDWSSSSAVFETLDMEIQELKAAVESGDQEAVMAEMGDVLFTAANLGRHLKINPEDALRRTNDRFLRRFEYIENSLETSGKSVEEVGLEEMDALWDEAKDKGL